ncbi:sensor histidine kinase [Stenotrophomonas maltophilia]|uniref:sensor histidine kinase n=1 Tax=Stenotrophomonas maltophilia TaxID=40324 RepID=UPI0034DB5FE6
MPPFRDEANVATSTPDITNAIGLKSLQRYPRRLLLACAAALCLLAAAAALLAAVIHVNQFQARRISEFRRAHHALQMELSSQEAGYARLVNMAEYAWQQGVPDHHGSVVQLRQRYLQGQQRVSVVADAGSRPQMALGVGTEHWDGVILERYLKLSQAVSLIQRLDATAVPEAGGAAYFFDPSASYLSLGQGLSEMALQQAQNVRDRQALFQRLRAPAKLLAAASRSDSIPRLIGVDREHRLQWDLGQHPLSGVPSLVASFYAYEGNAPIAAFVAYEPLARIEGLLQSHSQGRVALLDAAGHMLAATYSAATAEEEAMQRQAGGWTLLGDAVRARRQGAHFVLALPVAGTPWTLVETFGWMDIWHGIRTPMQGVALAIAAVLAAGLLLLLWLHQRSLGPAIAQLSALYLREQRQQQLIDSLPHGLALLDPQTGEVCCSNPALHRLNDAQVPALLERMQQPQFLAQLRNTGEGVVLASDPVAGAHSTVRLSVIRADACPDTPLLLLVEDVSGWQARLEQGRQALEAAQRRMQAKSAFIASVSHEIRTPLHGIMGHLELLARSTLAPAQRARVARLHESTESLMHVITNALDLSRAEFGQLVAPSAVFSPRAVVERVALLFGPLAQAKDLQLECMIDPRVPSLCHAAEDHVERVLRNLVGNAVKFTGSGRVLLALSHEQPGGQDVLRLEVVDSGIGMSAAEQARLFQPFVQADPSIGHRFGGSGLGLALCRQLCEGLGAQIEVQSSPGVGSRFVVLVPVDVVQGAPPSPWAGDEADLVQDPAGGWREALERSL